MEIEVSMSTDDTQPRSPFQNGSPERETQESAVVRAQHPDDGGPAGPGCFVWGLLGLVGVGCLL